MADRYAKRARRGEETKKSWRKRREKTSNNVTAATSHNKRIAKVEPRILRSNDRQRVGNQLWKNFKVKTKNKPKHL